MTRKQKRIVRRAWNRCNFTWPPTFVRPKVELVDKSGFGHYDFIRNVIVVNRTVMEFAEIDRQRRKMVQATILHEAFHALDYQCLTNDDRRHLVAAFHDGHVHPTTPADQDHPWDHNARDESAWTDHGHAWWDDNYAESLMEVSADVFVQAFSDLTSQTHKRWVHKITPIVEDLFAEKLKLVTA